MMPRPLRELASAVRLRQLLRVDRSPIDTVPMDGFAIGLSERFLLLHLVEQTIQLNGYTVLRLEDIADWGEHPYRPFVLQALRGRGEVMRPLDDLPLDHHRAVFAGVKDRWPLVAIHTEEVDSHRCWIGRVLTCGKQGVTLRKINPLAQWIETEQFPYRHITRIDWEGLYEQALWQVHTGQPQAAGPIPSPIRVNGKVKLDPECLL